MVKPPIGYFYMKYVNFCDCHAACFAIAPYSLFEMETYWHSVYCLLCHSVDRMKGKEHSM